MDVEALLTQESVDLIGDKREVKPRTRSRFILSLLHRVQRQRGSKISVVPADPLLDAFRLSTSFLPPVQPTLDLPYSLPSNEVQNPLPALSGYELYSSRMRPSSNGITVVIALPRESPRVL